MRQKARELVPATQFEHNIAFKKQRTDLQDEGVWMLLLSQLWQDPIDQQILCRLLCCSSAMASLVHRTCSGRVHVAVKMLAIAPGREQWLGRWLAKHASLLHSLWLPRRIQDLAPHCEECIAAGLSAAAGPSSLYRSRFTRSQASAAAAVACVTAASVDASLSSSPPAGVAPPRQGFLLQRLVCLQPSSGPILCSLAGSTQLTRLEVILTVQAAAQPACQQALASLTGLRELKLSQLVALSSPRRTSQMAFGKLVQELQAFSQLTKLQLDTLPQSCQDRCLQCLPASLQWLTLTCDVPRVWPINLSHLTAVTFLDLNCCLQQDVLPPNLVRLSACGGSMRPLLLLPKLQSVWLSITPSLTELQRLCAATQLTQLHLTVAFTGRWPANEQAAAVFSQLPLTRLQIAHTALTPFGVAALGSLTKLWCLQLHSLRLNDSMERLAAQLQQLPLLKCLIVQKLDPQLPGDDDWASLTHAIGLIPSLRRFVAAGLPLGGAAASLLASATQLSSLELRNCSLTHHTRALLQSKLQHMGARQLVVP